MFYLRPVPGDQQQHISTADVECAMANASGLAAGKGDADLRTDASVTRV